MESLNDAWEEFTRVNEAYYLDRDEARVPFELTTAVALRLPDGREATGVLCICYFDNVKERHGTDDGGHVGIQFDFNDRLESGQLDGGLFDFLVNYPPDAVWTKALIIEVFNIDSDSAIWKREDAP